MQRLPAEEYAKAEVWEKMWNEKTPPFWHKPEVHSELVKQYSDWTAGRKALRLLVPLCGKSVDLLWLADRGHTVIGVELVEKPVQEFFTENNLAYEVKNEQTSSPTEPVLKFYCSINKADKDITIYVCDIFQFINSKPMDEFDGIWDRGSLIAMILSEGDRAERYVQGLLAMLAPDGRYLAESIRHDEGEDESNNEMNAPNMTEENIKELFGDRCNLRQVDIKFLDKDPEAKGRPQMAHSMIYHIITFNQ